MSAAAARRRKQLEARQTANDSVAQQLQKILTNENDLDEATAYEALQMAQSQVRKHIKSADYSKACDLSYETSLALLKKKRVSVASQLLDLLVQVLRETHTEESPVWLERLQELHEAHAKAMEEESLNSQEAVRLERLQRDWLQTCANWSSDLGTIKYGNNSLQKMLGFQCWKLSKITDDEEETLDLQCSAVQHMMCAEEPLEICRWLESLPAPTEEQTKQGHTCAPALRDGLLTRSLLLACALENLRDANALLQAFIEVVTKEGTDVQALAKSYTNKEDGKAPSHLIFGCMLLRVCEKDVRTGPLFTWLMKSFRRELDLLPHASALQSYTTKVGKLYFNIQPPPSMISMMENMMGMMGGGGGMGGMNPAMMQAMAAQMRGM